MEFKKGTFVIVKETEKAICLKLEGVDLWFPKSKVSIGDDVIIADAIYQNTLLEKQNYNENNNKLISLVANKDVEDYSENSYRFFVTVQEKATKKEYERFLFAPKNKCEIDGKIINIPNWLFLSSEENTLTNLVEYLNKEENANFSNRDFEIINEIK